jgi:hypothetical protein
VQDYWGSACWGCGCGSLLGGRCKGLLLLLLLQEEGVAWTCCLLAGPSAWPLQGGWLAGGCGLWGGCCRCCCLGGPLRCNKRVAHVEVQVPGLKCGIAGAIHTSSLCTKQGSKCAKAA